MPPSSIAFRVLRHFPGTTPVGKVSREQLRARIIARQELLLQAQDDRIARTMLPDSPPVTNPPYQVVVAAPSMDTSKQPRVTRSRPMERGPVFPEIPGVPQALLEQLGRGGGTRQGADLESMVNRLVDALYDNAVLSNPDVMAFGTAPTPLIITPGTPLKAADNNGGEKPLFVRLKAEADTNGTKTFLYAAPFNITGQAAGATIAKYDVGPVIDLVLNGAGTVYVDGTAPAGQTTFKVIVSSFYLAGRKTVYNR